MPLGNFVVWCVRFPLASRVKADQQSSMVRYLYPAAARPLLTRASAVCRTTVSLIPLHANLFQLFQPMGGVRARPSSRARARKGVRTNTQAAASTRRSFGIESPPWGRAAL